MGLQDSIITANSAVTAKQYSVGESQECEDGAGLDEPSREILNPIKFPIFTATQILES